MSARDRHKQLISVLADLKPKETPESLRSKEFFRGRMQQWHRMVENIADIHCHHETFLKNCGYYDE